MEIRKVTDPSFAEYGKVVTGYDVSELLKAMEEKTPLSDDVVYVPSVKELEDLSVSKLMQKNLYGQIPVQVGYCNGHNKKLNALEYHRSSEINVAVTDLVLLIGRQQDIEADYTYDTSKVVAYLVPAGTVIEVYATTLHYAPCHTDEGGFRCVVILPAGTNTDLDPLDEVFAEDKLLFAKNKWLIGHAEGGLDAGAFIGLKGENITL